MDETRCDGSFWNSPRLWDSSCVHNTTPTRQRRRRGRVLHVATAVAACLVTASAASSSQQDNDSGYRDAQPYCQRNYVKVSKMWLLCDSPGAYYYGGSAYRNSEVCMSGDKAKLRAQIRIPSDIEGTIGLEIDSGLYGSFQTVTTTSNICQDMSVTASYYDDGTGECPSEGYYDLQTTFTVPSIRDYYFHYTPDVKLTFVDGYGHRIGCSTSGTAALHHMADRRATNGTVALGISVVIFVGVFALLLYLSYRRKKRLEQKTEHKKTNYQYFRTLPSGQVIPLPGSNGAAQVVSMPRPSINTMNEAVNISNPAYNEPQIPTRPII